MHHKRPQQDYSSNPLYPTDSYPVDDPNYPQTNTQSQQSAPSTVYNPAGFSVTQPSASKRNDIMKCNQDGMQKYDQYIDCKTQRARDATKGPPRLLEGRQLSQSELQDKWKNEEWEGKRKHFLTGYEKKQRWDRYKHDEKEREEKEIQEKKAKARNLANKQAIQEKDRNLSHGMIAREMRLCQFDQPSLSVGSHLTHSERIDKQLKEEQEGIKQEKLAEIAKHRRRTDYERIEKEKEEREIDEKKLRARNVANKQAIQEKELSIVRAEETRLQRLKYYKNNNN